MISRSMDFDLGRDRTRMKDRRDWERQAHTVDAILDRFFTPDAARRFEIQVLADEVGMGKTFVALGVAYSILAAMRERVSEDDLRWCYQRVLIVTPPNEALFDKWNQEVGEFVKRCVKPEFKDAAQWFRPVAVRRIDELSSELRTRGGRPRVLVTTMGLFSGAKLVNYDLKRRVLLGVLFRHWANRFATDKRARLLKGAPEGWPTASDLTDLTEKERQQLPFEEEEILGALARLERESEPIARGLDSLESLLELCREIAEPYNRRRREQFDDLERKLTTLYRAVAGTLILQAFPLVIVDEAHNWKNGPSSGANGYREFTRFIGCRTRRALLLTATPFQLRPQEMLEILKVADGMAPASTKTDSAARSGRLAEYREKVVSPVLENSADASRRFAKEWTRLTGITREELADIWRSPALARARSALRALAAAAGVIDAVAMEALIGEPLREVTPDLRPFLRQALCLYAYNSDLSKELGALVIRHRRRTEHRLFRVGAEHLLPYEHVVLRPDAHLLHGAPGLDVSGDGELPHYLLMRCVTEAKKAKRRPGRSSLGSALTGCYSTLNESAEGREVNKLLSGSPEARVYLELLTQMVGVDQDPDHPKVRAVVESVVESWRRGDKSLVFCFRVNTAKRLSQIIDAQIRQELERRGTACLGGADQLDRLRKRLTAREQDLIGIGLDRVLWSMAWAWAAPDGSAPCLTAEDFGLTESDLRPLAELSVAYGVPLVGDRADRVFLHRAAEHVLARRLLRDRQVSSSWSQILNSVADRSWVSHPYGLGAELAEETDVGEAHDFDERGVHTVYEANGRPDAASVEATLAQLVESRAHAGKRSILDSYAIAPNLWLGEAPLRDRSADAGDRAPLLRELHDYLWKLTRGGRGELDWESRRQVMQALRKAILRRSVLLRLLPEHTEDEESSWGELLVRTFFASLPGQQESMAARITVFLQDLEGAGGSLSATDPSEQGLRHALLGATRMSDKPVALVTGGGGGKDLEARNRVFAGFNTPLLPEVLICTQVGQEGIDLHRHCRSVVHYDLAWNPAVLEQRTGRADRIGSKTFRERDMVKTGSPPRLEVSVPFLAGTYDERMFEELRLRAQMFEVLTGGEFAAENAEGDDVSDDAEGAEGGWRVVPLPDEMVRELRVNLQVWREDSVEAPTAPTATAMVPQPA